MPPYLHDNEGTPFSHTFPLYHGMTISFTGRTEPLGGERRDADLIAIECVAPPKLRVLSLFAGVGGFDLGLERTGGFETVAFCEIEPFAQRVLAKHWPEVPIYHDVRELTSDRLRADGISVDVICGGFPCQKFSTAARGRNNARDFWPEMRSIAAQVRPRFVIAENISEKAIANAASDLSDIGYGCHVRRISAADCGADHQRDRWWLVAHADHESELPRLIDAEMAELPKLCGGLWGPGNYARAVRIPDGVSHRMDRLRCLGNAVLPQIPELIGNAILQSLHQTLGHGAKGLASAASEMSFHTEEVPQP